MKKIILLFIGLIIGFLLYSQSSFDFTYKKGIKTGFTDTFEDANNNLLSIGSTAFGSKVSQTYALITKVNSSGMLVKDTLYSKQDTSVVLQYGFQKANGNYFVMGTATDIVGFLKRDHSYFCELSPDLDIVWEKFYKIPEPYRFHTMLNFIHEPDSSILIMGKADSSNYSFNDNLFISRVSINGDILDFNFYEGWQTYGVYDSFIPNYDSIGYLLIGDFVENSFLREWIELDENLGISSYIPYLDINHFFEGGTTVRWLSNGNMMVITMDIMNSPPSFDIYVKVMNQEHETLKDTVIDHGVRKFNPVAMNAIDFIEESNVWMGSYTNEPIATGLMEHFYFYLFDSDGNIKGSKECGGDLGYWMFNLRATSDGGCTLTGHVGNSVGSDTLNGYMIKVMPEDLISSIEEKPKNEKKISIYPSPFTNYLYCESYGKEILFRLFDNTGKEVLAEKIYDNTTISTEILKPSLYYYTMTDNETIIQSGKLIKIKN